MPRINPLLPQTAVLFAEQLQHQRWMPVDECHSRDATAVTPVSLFRLSRSNFLALIHRHPTLVLRLLSKQHSRLRQQRIDARHFY